MRSRIWGRRLPAARFVVALLLFGGASLAPHQQAAAATTRVSSPRAPMPPAPKWVKVYFGRMHTEVLAAGEYTVEVRSHGVSVEVSPWPLPATAPEAAHRAEYQRHWEEFLPGLKRLNNGSGADSESFTIIADETTQPLQRTLYFQNESTGKQAMAVHAMLVWRGRWVHLWHRQELGSEPAAAAIAPARALLQQFIDGMDEIPSANADWTPSETDLFADLLRFKNVPFDPDEEYQLTFSHPQWPGELSLERTSDTVAGPSTRQLYAAHQLEELEEPQAARLRTLRNRNRRVAGLDGDEFAMMTPPHSKPHSPTAGAGAESDVFGCIWEYWGGTGPYSRVQFEWKSSSALHKEKLALWDHVLDSVRYHGPKMSKAKVVHPQF